jgi:hypothetical protein
MGQKINFKKAKALLSANKKRGHPRDSLFPFVSG